tara:strand:- start:3235 stop:4371 length:1137 start_codon:yes stop_codon:yes gene_type:complete
MDSQSSLGNSTTHQTSIDEKVDQKKIEKILIKNINKITIGDDKYSKDIINSITSEKKLNFNLNKHEEIFCNSIKNTNYLLKYLTFRYKFRLAGKKKEIFDYPPYLLIEPVSACNLRCPFCFQADQTFTKKPFMGIMKWDLFKKVVDEADKIGVGAITFASRGEPTMHKKLGEMIKYVSKKKNIFEFKLNTNGTFLNEELCHQIFQSKITQVVISADHYIKEDYERLRKGSNFEDTVKKTDLLYSIRKKHYKNSTTEIRISGVDNDKDLDRKKFKEFWKKRSDHVSATFPYQRWNTYKNSLHPEINDACENFWDRMYVWFDGKVNPCDADYKSYLSYGDLNNNSILEVWNSKKVNQFRKLHLDGKRKDIDPCNKCGKTF